MRIYEKIVLGMALSANLYGCGAENKTNNEPEQNYFSEREKIGELDVDNRQTGVAVALGDMDNDGDLDMVIATSSELFYFENTGSGKFNKKVKIPYGSSQNQPGMGVALGDIDKDGDLDIIIASLDGVFYIKNNLPQKNKK